MSIQVRKNLVATSKHSLKCPNSMTAQYITIHNTYNDASADAEVRYMISNNNATSFHFAVDDKEVVQGIPVDRNAWHCGDGNKDGNRKSIGVEICYSKSGGDRYKRAETLAIKFIAQLLKERGWDIDRLRKHQDWSGKYCPHRILDEGRYGAVINAIASELKSLNGTTQSTTTGGLEVGSTATVKKTATNYETGEVIKDFVKGGKYKILKVKDVSVSNSHKAYLLDDILSWVLEQDIEEVPQQPAFIGQLEIIVDVLNVRTGPGEEHGIIGKAKKGNVYNIISNHKNLWLEIAYADGVHGYVSTGHADGKEYVALIH